MGRYWSLDMPNAKLCREPDPSSGQWGKLHAGLLTPAGILQGGRSGGKTFSRGSPSLGRGPELEGKSWCCCCKVRKKPGPYQPVAVPCPHCAADPTCGDEQRCAGGDVALGSDVAGSSPLTASGVGGQRVGRLSPKPGPWQAILLATQPQHGAQHSRAAPVGCWPRSQGEGRLGQGKRVMR